MIAAARQNASVMMSPIHAPRSLGGSLGDRCGLAYGNEVRS
jgi:hypothetical protein